MSKLLKHHFLAILFAGVLHFIFLGKANAATDSMLDRPLHSAQLQQSSNDKIENTTNRWRSDNHSNSHTAEILLLLAGGMMLLVFATHNLSKSKITDIE